MSRIKENAFLRFIKKLFTHDGKIRPCIVPSVCLIALCIVAAMGINSIFASFHYEREELSGDPAEIGILEMDRPKGITNIALFGIDARNDSFRGLSDSIMIISVDANHNSIKIISVMRDSLVKVDGYGHQKINAAYNIGGAELAVKTLNQTFNMDITDYATVDFVSMANIIDVVGGIEAELTEKEVANANKQIREMARQRKTPKDEIQQAGKQTLSGIQAVAYARIRKTATVNGTNNDFGRTERQRYVMEQLFEKALKLDVRKYPAMIKALLPHMRTSLSYQDVFSLAGILLDDQITFKQARIPATRAIITWGLSVPRLGSCMYYDLEYAADQLHAFIYDDISFEDYMDQYGVRKNRWYQGNVNQSDPDPDVLTPDTPEEEESTPDLNGGETTDPNGSTTDPNGGITDPNGGTTDPNGGITDPNGSTTDPNGSTTDPNGSTTDPNGSTTDPNGSTTDPSGSTTDPSGSTSDPNGSTADPNNNAATPPPSTTPATPTV